MDLAQISGAPVRPDNMSIPDGHNRGLSDSAHQECTVVDDWHTFGVGFGGFVPVFFIDIAARIFCLIC